MCINKCIRLTIRNVNQSPISKSKLLSNRIGLTMRNVNFFSSSETSEPLLVLD